jgi:hypothetical protein
VRCDPTSTAEFTDDVLRTDTRLQHTQCFPVSANRHLEPLLRKNLTQRDIEFRENAHANS